MIRIPQETTLGMAARLMQSERACVALVVDAHDLPSAC